MQHSSQLAGELPPEDQAVAEEMKRIKVLVVDDFRHIRDGLRGALEERGFENVFVAVSAIDALKILNEEEFGARDVVFLDYNLGSVMNGAEFLSRTVEYFKEVGAALPQIVSVTNSSLGREEMQKAYPDIRHIETKGAGTFFEDASNTAIEIVGNRSFIDL